MKEEDQNITSFPQKWLSPSTSIYTDKNNLVKLTNFVSSDGCPKTDTYKFVQFSTDLVILSHVDHPDQQCLVKFNRMTNPG